MLPGARGDRARRPPRRRTRDRARSGPPRCRCLVRSAARAAGRHARGHRRCAGAAGSDSWTVSSRAPPPPSSWASTRSLRHRRGAPRHGSRGVGTALLTEAVAAFPDIDRAAAVSNDDPISLAFAVRNGFLPEGEHRISFVDPADRRRRRAGADRAAPGDPGRSSPTCGCCSSTYNARPPATTRAGSAAALHDDTSLRSEWWDNPDNAPEPVLRAHRRRRPAARPRGVHQRAGRPRARPGVEHHDGDPSDVPAAGAGPVGQATDADGPRRDGVTEAWTGNDSTNAAMLAVNEQLGYVAAATSIRLARRLSF